MTKGLRYLGDKDGIAQFEEYEVDEQIIEQHIDYDAKVVELIRQRYSIDDELSINTKSMKVALNLCSDDNEKQSLISEIQSFVSYVSECKINAKNQ